MMDAAEQSYDDSVMAVILDTIEINQETGCFEWTGPTLPSGYGRMYYKGGSYYAHRVAWMVEIGPIPKGNGYHGTCVCHHCDNPRCVNTDHMFLGSMADNVADRDAKGRGQGGPNQPNPK